LAKALPSGAHASPGWNYTNLPAIKIGIKYKNRISDDLSCGVVALHGELFFWIDKSCIGYDSNGCKDDLWCEYTYAEKTRINKKITKFYYNKPLNGESDFDDR
ncbi:hypothetical protein RZS08_62165, partial [Arthrospira platensis SPKY1]|nr:hypothetical protein [Arthrospira platensis SPKY1]